MKIVNIGSLNIDKTYSVKRFVQPKETIQALKYEEFCGGKGLNQSVALARAGAEVYHAGAVGADGALLTDMLESSGVHTDYLLKTDGASGHAVIQIDESGQNNIIICGGANREITKEYIDSVLEHFESTDLLLLQNEISNVDHAIRKAKEKGMTIALNPSPVDDIIQTWPLELVNYFIINELEGRELAGIESEVPADIMQALRAKFPHVKFVLTLGENGSYYFDQEKEVFHDIFRVKAVDTTGAGDTFCGYFIAGLSRGLDVETILAQASAASAIAVGRKGAAPSVPVLSEVKEFLKQH